MPTAIVKVTLHITVGALCDDGERREFNLFLSQLQSRTVIIRCQENTRGVEP